MSDSEEEGGFGAGDVSEEEGGFGSGGEAAESEGEDGDFGGGDASADEKDDAPAPEPVRCYAPPCIPRLERSKAARGTTWMW